MSSLVNFDLINLSLLPISFVVAALSATGRLSRAGPGRAAVLALNSLLKPRSAPLTVRAEELAWLGDWLKQGHWDDQFIAILGPKGVGKTCLLSTAVSHTAGVVEFKVHAGHSAEKIELDVMRAITNLSNTFQRPEASLRRVVFWHRLFTLGKSPIVIMNLVEHNQSYAEVSNVARSLAATYKLRVVLDTSPNSLEDRALRSDRCMRLEVEPMTKEQMETIAEYEGLRNWLKEAGLYHVAVELLGGNPAKWKYFLSKCKTCLSASASKRREILSDQLLDLLGETRSDMDAAGLNGDPHLDEIADLYFQNKQHLTTSTLKKEGLTRPSLDKVFRHRKTREGEIIEPITPLVYYVLKYARTKPITTIEDLKGIVQKEITEKNLKD